MKADAYLQCPLETLSGYGLMARDICKHIIDLQKYNVTIVSLPWGMCPIGNLDPGKDKELLERTVYPPVNLNKQPELFIQVSVPNEFQPIGKYNCGITAGIETNLISIPWIEGCNRMNAIFTISEHSKRVIESTVVEKKDQHGNIVEKLKVNVPVEVLPNCVDLDIFKKIESPDIPQSINDAMFGIKEKFNYLFVGHWMRGALGEDRKNVGVLVKTFCETFKHLPSATRPGLILKSSGGGFSILDREDILNKIKSIRNSVGNGCPNVYLVHGDLTEEEMNGLYNHSKVKVHVSFSKGEGFGKPLLEASMSEKPVIASGWSGQLDFLDPDHAILVGGELRNIEPGSVWENVLIPESQWFNVDPKQASNALLYAFKNYDKLIPKAEELAKMNRKKFSYEAVFNRTKELINKYVPTFAIPVQLKLPELKRNA